MPCAVPVSVIIPAFNAGAHIGETLASVRAQTREPAEVIVVDDGSSDATAALARAGGARVIEQSNRGVAHARNTGVRSSGAAWIAFLDADDLWGPAHLETEWSLHEQRPEARLVASDYYLLRDGRLGAQGVMAGLRRYRTLPRRALRGGSAVPRAALLAALVEGNFMLPSSMLVARDIFERHGVYFSERERLPSGANFLVGEDYEWLLRVLRFTDVLIADAPLVTYRRTAASLSAHGGRLRYGDVILGSIVCAAPERYALGAAAAFRRLRPRHLRESGLRFLAGGDVVTARKLFVEALRARADARSLGLAAATQLFAGPGGTRAFARLFALWRAWR